RAGARRRRQGHRGLDQDRARRRCAGQAAAITADRIIAVRCRLRTTGKRITSLLVTRRRRAVWALWVVMGNRSFWPKRNHAERNINYISCLGCPEDGHHKPGTSLTLSGYRLRP